MDLKWIMNVQFNFENGFMEYDKISHEIACGKVLTEFEKYRIIQDKLYESD